jgi:hypothetical protein
LKKNLLQMSLIFALFIGMSTFFTASANVSEVQQEPELIVIGTADGTELKYNITEVSLEKNKEYNITFVNTQPGILHNLVIVKPDTLARGSDIDSYENTNDGKLIGPVGNDFNQVGPKTWSALWKTPNEDVWVQYGCSVVGHFEAGMVGWFKVGNPGAKPVAASPGFELIVGIIAFLGLAFYRLRKN